MSGPRAGARPASAPVFVLLLALAALTLAGCSSLSQENFNRIEKGMHYDEVTAILGTPSDSKSVGVGPLSGTAATWEDGETRIEIKFLNEKVQVKSRRSVDG